ncbi:MAG: tRNA (guanosine(46)-N7)-methyltransferase TrmB [Bacteroidales bacterium]|nr:tRNA (guanosine(46)-N7)-methyltransferase TrmB [Bacteroidales bacterium]MCR5191992.1 tRNA (guanosine(46)-N7)-methyltransferase TrmB [Bacteroidales bacterium]
MGKHKLARFAENLTFPNLIQVSFEDLKEKDFIWYGKWSAFFGNDNPIVLELGCGKGEYTVALARRQPNRNYIGIDIKGARMWRGAKTSNEEKMSNVAFLRTRIELINRFFAPEEVSEIWITFPDPQPKKPMKRLTSPRFLNYYSQLLLPHSPINLKTDSRELYDYTIDEVITPAGYSVEFSSPDLYSTDYNGEAVDVKTFYESMFLKEGKPITYIRFRMN